MFMTKRAQPLTFTAYKLAHVIGNVESSRCRASILQVNEDDLGKLRDRNYSFHNLGKL